MGREKITDEQMSRLRLVYETIKIEDGYLLAKYEQGGSSLYNVLDDNLNVLLSGVFIYNKLAIKCIGEVHGTKHTGLKVFSDPLQCKYVRDGKIEVYRLGTMEKIIELDGDSDCIFLKQKVFITVNGGKLSIMNEHGKEIGGIPGIYCDKHRVEVQSMGWEMSEALKERAMSINLSIENMNDYVHTSDKIYKGNRYIHMMIPLSRDRVVYDEYTYYEAGMMSKILMVSRGIKETKLRNGSIGVYPVYDLYIKGHVVDPSGGEARTVNLKKWKHLMSNIGKTFWCGYLNTDNSNFGKLTVKMIPGADRKSESKTIVWKAQGDGSEYRVIDRVYDDVSMNMGSLVMQYGASSDVLVGCSKLVCGIREL